ncbi:MAG TPA: transporter [Gemmatimonadaceae bacterium]|nr:transporter [Gemmatimonadaceae bacterium]
MQRTTAAVALVAAMMVPGRATPAQEPPRDPHAAQPERPTVATHAGTVAPGWLELESGLEFDRGPGRDRNTLFGTLAKVGVSPHTQLSVFVAASAPRGAAGGIGDVAITYKWRVMEHDGLLGDVAIQPGLTLPTGSISRGTGTETTDASLLLISSRDVGPLHIDLNAGYTRRSGSGANAPRDQWVWTASFGGVLQAATGWTAEVFGYPGTGGPSGASPVTAVLAGPTYTARRWLVFDVGVIVPVAGPQPHALYAGATWNVGKGW